MQRENTAALVVAEHTGNFPASIESEMPGRATVTIVSQVAGELSGAFADRVARRVRRHQAPRRPNIGILCCGRRSDDASWNARASVASALSSAIEPGGKLVICAAHDAGHRALPRFLELVEKLKQQGSPSTLSVRLRFESEESSDRAEHRENDVPVTASAWRLTA